MPHHDTPDFEADADAAAEVVDTSQSELADPPSLPPEADLDIRPTGRGDGGSATADGDPIDDAPWQQSELPPAQRRRRLIVLAVVAVGFVVGAALWAFGFGRNLSGNFEAAVNRSEEAEVREAAVVVPEEDYVIDLDQCDVDVGSGRVTVAGSMTLKKGGRAGTHQVLVAFVDGEDDVTTAEASDNVSLTGPGSSAPIYALGDALTGHPNVDCVPLQVSRLIGSPSATGDSKGGS